MGAKRSWARGSWIHVVGTDVWDEDAGEYTSYAGPTYLYGKGHRADWGGGVKIVFVTVHGSDRASLKERRVTEVR